MPFIKSNAQRYIEVTPHFTGRLVDTEKGTMNLVRWDIKAGEQLPQHQHPEEQITHIIEGEFALTVGDETMIVTAGDAAVIPANVPHGGKALTDCTVIDVFTPARQITK